MVKAATRTTGFGAVAAMVTAQRSLGSFTTVLFGHEQGKYPDGNSVLVRGTHSSVLIDPSLSVHAADPPIEVDRVLLTHAHEDHMAGVSAVRAGAINGNANGGYLLALAARHMVAVSGRPHPVSVTAHYLAPGKPGPVRVDAAVVKAGRRFATVSGQMHAGGKPTLQMVAPSTRSRC